MYLKMEEMYNMKESEIKIVVKELEAIKEKAKGLRYEDKHDLVLDRIKELETEIKWKQQK